MSKKHPTYKNAWYTLATSRILIGFIFLWAFLDKTFGLGYATESGSAWVNGVSPTAGFLGVAVNPDSPFAEMFNNMSGIGVVDWLFMVGLLGIGTALILGIGLRIAAASGTILLLMMWAALIPLENNPAVDDHIVYSVMLWVFAFSRREWSIANWWLSKKFVRNNSWLW